MATVRDARFGRAPQDEVLFRGPRSWTLMVRSAASLRVSNHEAEHCHSIQTPYGIALLSKRTANKSYRRATKCYRQE